MATKQRKSATPKVEAPQTGFTIVRSTPEPNRWPPPGAPRADELHNILGANIDGVEFYSRVKQLDQPTRDKIVGVGSRLQLVNALQYESAFSASWNRVQADALQVYLLCTCLDALAGQLNYRQFHEWIAATEQRQLLENACIEADLQTTPLQDWYRQVTKRLGAQWLETHGVSRNFRRFIAELPEALRRELINSYAIVKEPKEGIEEWTGLREDVRLKRVVSYLYDLRRNTFTHRAQIVPTIAPGQGVSGLVCAIPQGMWKYAVYLTNVDEVRGEVSLLRIVLIGAIRKLIGYPVDQAFVDLHWQVERMRRLTRLALRELEYNDQRRSMFLQSRPVDLSSSPAHLRPKRFVYRALQKLATSRDIDFSWFYPLTRQEDQEIRTDIRGYLAEIERINGLVESFETKSLRPRVREKTKIESYDKIREAVRDNRWTELGEKILGGLYYILESAPENLE